MSGNARQARFAGLGRTMGRVALVGGVAASLALGQLAPVAALAEGEAPDATKGSITINSNNYRKGELSYLGYQVFKAAVGKDGSVSDVQWANDDVKAAVEGVIRAEDASYRGTTAQDAAVWIRAHVQKDAYWLKATDPVGKIAKAISGKTSTVTAKPDVAASVDQGYWLFVTDPASTNDKVYLDGTSPLFVLVGTDPVDVTEKTDLPHVEKTVTDDAGRRSIAADSQMGQELSYRLEGSLPMNFDSYDKYYYQFEDTLSKGLTLGSDVKVEVDCTDEKGGPVTRDATGKFKVERVSNADGTTTLRLTCDDVKAIDGLDASSTIRVTYKAKINEKAVMGGKGNRNDAKITYSNNPNSDSKGTSHGGGTTNYTFRLDICKVDAATKRPLAGAKFTIQATDPDDEGSKNKYVQEDGSLGSTPFVFTTDEKGMIDAPRIDSGTYTIHETEAPKTDDGTYDKVPDFGVEISPSYVLPSSLGTDDGGAYRLTVRTLGGDGYVTGGIDANGDGVIDEKDSKEKIADAATGTARVTVGDRLQTSLPVTGRSGIAMAVGTGLVIVTASVIAINRRRGDGRVD